MGIVSRYLKDIAFIRMIKAALCHYDSHAFIHGCPQTKKCTLTTRAELESKWHDIAFIICLPWPVLQKPLNCAKPWKDAWLPQCTDLRHCLKAALCYSDSFPTNSWNLKWLLSLYWMNYMLWILEWNKIIRPKQNQVWLSFSKPSI